MTERSRMPYWCLGFSAVASEEELTVSAAVVVALPVALLPVPVAAATRPERVAVPLELLDAEPVPVGLPAVVARVVLPETVWLAEPEEDEDPEDEEEDDEEG